MLAVLCSHSADVSLLLFFESTTVPQSDAPVNISIPFFVSGLPPIDSPSFVTILVFITTQPETAEGINNYITVCIFWTSHNRPSTTIMLMSITDRSCFHYTENVDFASVTQILETSFSGLFSVSVDILDDDTFENTESFLVRLDYSVVDQSSISGSLVSRITITPS